MRILIIILLFSFASCDNKKPKYEQLELEANDTQMAEVSTPLKISKQDSTALLKSFKLFCLGLKNEDGILISQLCMQKKSWPRSLNAMLNLPPSFPDFLISSPIKKLYKSDVWYAMQNDTPRIYNNYEKYYLSFATKNVTNKFITGLEHSFEFIKSGDTFKFNDYRSEEVSLQDIYPSIDSITVYFQKSGLSNPPQQEDGYLDRFSNVWYSQILKSLDEPVLYNYKTTDEIYRFTWLRSFHLPVVIRIQKHNFNFSIIVKVLSERIDNEPDDVITNTSESIFFLRWMVFKNKLNKADFWNMPMKDTSAQGNDGAEWVMEGIQNGKYHFVDRWSARGSEFGEACKYLISISGLDIKEKDIY